jgi:hypothetical protein
MTVPLNPTLPGVVDEIINPPDPTGPGRAQISIQGEDELIGKIRIVNTLTKTNGDEVSLNKRDTVKVTIKA